MTTNGRMIAHLRREAILTKSSGAYVLPGNTWRPFSKKRESETQPGANAVGVHLARYRGERRRGRAELVGVEVVVGIHADAIAADYPFETAARPIAYVVLSPRSKSDHAIGISSKDFQTNSAGQLAA